MNNALKIIGIILTVAGGASSIAHLIPGQIGAWMALGGLVLHQAAHTIGDFLDDGQLNDSFKDGK